MVSEDVKKKWASISSYKDAHQVVNSGSTKGWGKVVILVDNKTREGLGFSPVSTKATKKNEVIRPTQEVFHNGDFIHPTLPEVNAITEDDSEDYIPDDFTDGSSIVAEDWEPYLEDPGYQSPEDAHVPLYSPRPKWSNIEAVADDFSVEPTKIQEQYLIRLTLPEVIELGNQDFTTILLVLKFRAILCLARKACSDSTVKMSRKVDSVKDINDSKETWRLVGDQIQVLIRHDHLLKWKEVIKENMTCIINNGSVYNNDFQWKVCDHSKKFVFLGGTTMKAIELQNIPPKGYFFKDFGEILQDIIGAVSEINHIQSNTPGKKVVVSVVLKDLKGNCINCNLWEIYGSKFLAYYNDPKNNGAIVILLTHAMVKDGQVSNAWSGSKLLINEDIPEIQDFMSKLPTNEQKEKPTQSAKSLSNWSGGSQYSPVERFVHNAKCMSLSQFCKIKHETLCVTVATTLKFAVSKYGWFYYGCTRCSSKAPNPEKAYECSCGQKVEQPIPRFKIEIYVSNGESKYRFVFWDFKCAAILGMTAEFMHNFMVENGEDDQMVYPDELEMLLNKKMAFRVKVQPTFSQASVWKLCDDEACVKEIENDYIVEDV
ncbi:hypothetical protein KIW84_045230 [Lathyrus oleraceus]|uniref:Replication factor A C-terminal domain-containing protein n=1 Tax=Pisum sativum TaxID=3888 RepID=A0A9D4XII7_PEA|nr:hypothetical protein KIW84_045230 [Pisum sativum]